MKKTYLQPAMDATILASQQIMAGSITFDDDKGTGEGNLNDDYAEGDAMSKGRDGFGLW